MGDFCSRVGEGGDGVGEIGGDGVVEKEGYEDGLRRGLRCEAVAHRRGIQLGRPLSPRVSIEQLESVEGRTPRRGCAL